MKKMKKYMSRLGAFTITMTPILFVIACTTTNSKRMNISEVKINSSKANDVQVVNHHHNKNQPQTNSLIHKFQLNNKELVVDHDMAILARKYYTGNIMHAGTKGWDEITMKSLSLTHNSSMFGANDSIIWLFDDDDDDGLSVDNFASTHFLEDTLLMRSQTLEKIYRSMKDTYFNKTPTSTENYIKFKKIDDKSGRLQSWYGSQTNHTKNSATKGGGYATPKDFQEAMKKIQAVYPTNVFQAIKTYYTKKSQKFAPTIIPQQFISYKQIAFNAIKMTFNYKVNLSLTNTKIKVIPAKGKTTINEKLKIGPLSIGGPIEWQYYNKIPYSASAFATKYDKKLV